MFPGFDDTLRKAMVQETELFFESQVRENHPIPDLLRANYTFLNEQLAQHYGINNIYGSHFRRVTLTDEHRFGLLGHASILTVTSYADRTSVVLRGKWVLENLLGAPPPPPPPNVPPLKENNRREQADRAARAHGAAPRQSGVRELSRADGSARFRARTLRCGRAIGARTTGEPRSTPTSRWTGRTIDSPKEFREALLSRGHGREFVGTVVEKLMTYALGRGVTERDAPTVRQLVRDLEQNDYRWSTLVQQIVRSTAVSDEDGRRAGDDYRPRRPLRADSKPSGQLSARRSTRMFITKMHLSRRTMLRGLGTMIALPLLDSMVPALTALAGTAAAPIRRFGVFYVPNGMSMPYWWPKGRGRAHSVAADTRSRWMNSRTECCCAAASPTNRRIRSKAAAITLAPPAPSSPACRSSSPSGADVFGSVSMDQIAAQQFAKETQLASLELGIESNAMLGACDGGSSCAYTNTIAWRTPTTPLPIENDPRAVFERLFGTSGSTDSSGTARAHEAGSEHSRFRRRRSEGAR